MISWHVFVFGDKLPCFCNESLTGGLCYLILPCCENNNVLFTAAMGPDLATMFEKHNDKKQGDVSQLFVCVR